MVVLCCIVVSLVAVERLVEMTLSARHAAAAFAQGGLEFGQGHLLPMKLLHTAFLLGCLFETCFTGGLKWPALSWPMGGLALAAQGLRYWCIATLGERWNIRVIVVPSLKPVTAGPYAYLRHPNYVAVMLEGIALPMLFGAWRTALMFTILNTLLLRTRIRCENAAIATVCGPYPSAHHDTEVAA